MGVLHAIGFGVGGLLVGWVYFSLMRYSLARLSREKTQVLQFVALALVRLVLFGGGLLGAVLVSTWCLITYALGFIVARTAAVAWARSPKSFSPAPSESGKDNA